MLQPANRNPGIVVVPEHQWHLSPGTHFNNRFNSTTAPTGWTYTGTPSALGTATGDFNSSSDDTPGGLNLTTNASAQSLRFQTLLFGSYAHRMIAEQILGYRPTKLCFRTRATFSGAANESNTGFGFVTTINATTTDGEKVAWVYSDGTNHVLRSNTTTDSGSAAGGAVVIEVKIDETNIEWFIDGASQGTISTPADVWPVSFQVNGAAGRTNDIALNDIVVWYE